MDYKLLVVGTKECKTKDVLSTIKGAYPPEFSALHAKWTDLARTLLDDPNQLVKDLRQKRLLDTFNLEDTVTEIITEFVAQKSTEATLDVLLEALLKDGMTTYADALKQKFGGASR